MDCREFCSQLETCLEERRNPPENLVQHGETCPQAGCLETWEDYILLNQAIPLWRERNMASQPHERHPGDAAKFRRSPLRFARATLTLTLVGMLTIIVAGRSQLGQQLQHSAMTLVFQKSDIANLSTRHALSSRSALSLQEIQSREDTESMPAAEMDSLAGLAGPAPVLWLANTSVRVTDSVSFVLMGGSQNSSESAGTSDWLSDWSEQLKPLEEDLDILRTLLLEQQENQSLLAPTGNFQPIT